MIDPQSRHSPLAVAVELVGSDRQLTVAGFDALPEILRRGLGGPQGCDSRDAGSEIRDPNVIVGANEELPLVL
jgi:hypothetical protein